MEDDLCGSPAGLSLMVDPIYLDYQATTPMAPEVFEAMVPWLRDKYANPHSTHKLGREAAAAVEVAREQVAALMPPSGRVIFTGSATEAINLAIFGLPEADLTTIATEHAAVLDCAKMVKEQGRKTTILSVDKSGLIDLKEVNNKILTGQGLVAAMLINNEIGTIQDVGSMRFTSEMLAQPLLCDAVQGFGRVPIPEDCHLVAASAHKIHGPKGIGVLWVKDGIELAPLIHGGGQEAGLRSGTLSPALCVGFGMAAKIAKECMQSDFEHVSSLATVAHEVFAKWTINGSTEHRYPGNLNIRRDGLDVARLMSDVRGVAFSAGSACASGSGRPSHVLKALGLTPGQIKSSIRLGFGRYTTEMEIREAANLINAAAEAQLA